MRALFTIAFAAAAAMPALASAAPTETATTGNDGAEQQRLICRRVEALSGSHVSRTRICHTAAQWRAMHDGNVDDDLEAMGPMARGIHEATNGYTSERGGPGAMPSPH